MRLALAAILTTVVPTLVGYRLVRGPATLRLGLGSMMGIAILAMGTMFGGLLGSAWIGALLAMVGAVAGARFVRQGSREPDASPPVLLVVVILAVGGVLLFLSLSRPVARFDGWAFWSLKAKAIAHSGDFGSPVFTDEEYEYSHRDYPPLLPSWQSTAYRISGDLRNGSPTQFQLAWLWTSGALALVSLVGKRRSAVGLILFAWVLAPQVVQEAITGYADVPMALFLIVGTVALIRSDDIGLAPGALLIAAASVTKGEGLVFALAILVPLVVARRFRRPALVAGAAILLAAGPWAAFTASHRLVGDVTRPPLEAGHVDPDIDPVERVPEVIRTLGNDAIKPSDWGILLPASLVAVGLSRFRPAPLVTAALLAAFAIVVVYLFTPFEVDWHLATSADRVLIAPIGILALAAEGLHLTRGREAPARG